MNYFNLQRIYELIDFTSHHSTLPIISRKIAASYKLQIIEDLEQTRKLALKINTRMTRVLSSSSTLNETAEGYSKNWVLGEYKLFKTILLLYSISYSIQISLMKTQHLTQMCQMFRKKESIMIEYQVATIAAKYMKSLCQWSEQENLLLALIIQMTPQPNWKEIAIELFQKSDKRFFRQFSECREQWNNHLNPSICKTEWTLQQDLKLMKLIEEKGYRWSYISKSMNGTRNQHTVKNRFNSLIKKWKDYKNGKKSSSSSNIHWEQELLIAIKRVLSITNKKSANNKRERQLQPIMEGVIQKQDEGLTELSESNRNDILPILAEPQDDVFSIEKYLTLDTSKLF